MSAESEHCDLHVYREAQEKDSGKACKELISRSLCVLGGN
jgi:hypothetical protein